jgi:hypothetical protein
MTRPPVLTAAQGYAQARARGLLGRWLVARTPVAGRYPCRCVLGRRCGARCGCAGRSDVDGLPARCCAVRPTETEVEAA